MCPSWRHPTTKISRKQKTPVNCFSSENGKQTNKSKESKRKQANKQPKKHKTAKKLNNPNFHHTHISGLVFNASISFGPGHPNAVNLIGTLGNGWIWWLELNSLTADCHGKKHFHQNQLGKEICAKVFYHHHLKFDIIWP